MSPLISLPRDCPVSISASPKIMRKKVPDHNTCKSRDIGGSAVHAHERQKEKGGKKKKKKHREKKRNIFLLFYL